MADVEWIGAVLGFFGVTALLVALCAKLQPAEQARVEARK